MAEADSIEDMPFIHTGHGGNWRRPTAYRPGDEFSADLVVGVMLPEYGWEAVDQTKLRMVILGRRKRGLFGREKQEREELWIDLTRDDAKRLRRQLTTLLDEAEWF